MARAARKHRYSLRGQVMAPGEPGSVDIRRRQAKQNIRRRARVEGQSPKQRIQALLRDGGEFEGKRALAHDGRRLLASS
jgi:hypothetical protein